MEEIIENLEKFDGKIITYVNDEAISAGAFIAIATSEIAFSPKSQIGAAEAVSGGGANIDSSMKRKINFYLKAKNTKLCRGLSLPLTGYGRYDGCQ